MKDESVKLVPAKRGKKTQSMLSMIVERGLAYSSDCPFCGVTIMNKEASITVRNAEYHVRTCEYNPDNKRCPTCKHWIRRYFPSRNACAIGEIVRDSDICFKHELKETKDES